MAGDRTGEIDFDEKLLVLDKGAEAVHAAVVAYLRNQRRGTASTKTRGEVAGSNRKPWRQKGTGRARAGTRSSPVWRGGGVAFGPRPRDFHRRVPKGIKRLAFRRALSEKISAGDVIVLEELNLSEPKTRVIAEILKKLDVRNGALIVTGAEDRVLRLAARNIPGVAVAASDDVNTYQLLRYRKVVATSEALKKLQVRLGDKAGGGK